MITMTKRLYTQAETDLVLDDDGAGSAGIGSPAGKKYVVRLPHLAAAEKPRGKLIAPGPSVLSIAELLAVILNVGTKKEDVLAMSNRLLKEYGDSVIVNQKDPKKIQELLGIPLGKACQLVACFELGRRLFKTQNGKKP